MRVEALGRIISVITFSLAWSYLIIYLLVLRNNYMSFYLACLLILVSILIQILRNYCEKLLYLEIILTFLALQLIPIAYAGLDNIFGLDVYFELEPIRRILTTGHWTTSTIGGLETSYYPAHHILVASLSLITNCHYENIVRFLPIFFNLIVLFFIFLIMKKIACCDHKTILLCLLCFSFTFPYTRAAFSHQFAVLPYFFAICYIFLKLLLNYSNGRFKEYKIILFIFIICLIYTHHFTRVMLLAYILTFYLIYMLFKRSDKVKRVLGISSGMLPNLNTKIIFGTVSILVLLFITYLFNTYELGVIKSIKMVVLTMIGIHNPTIPHIIPSKSILSIGMVLYYYGLATILLISVFVVLLDRSNSNRFLVMSFIAYAVISFTLHVFLRFALNVGVEPFRASIFDSPFMLIALFYTLSLKLPKQKIRRFNFLTMLMILLVVFYIVINLLPISKFYIDTNYRPNWDHNEFKRYVGMDDKAGVLWGINHGILERIVGDTYIYRLYIYYTSRPIIENYKLFIYLVNNTYDKSNNYKYFYLTNMDKYRIFIPNCKIYPFPKVTKKMYIEYQINDKLSKIYNNNEIEIYRIY